MSIETDFFNPEIYYSKEAAFNYEKNKRMQQIQKEMTERALELIELKKGKILDIGCGTGFSMQAIKDNGFEVQGIDISQPMINIAKKKGFKVKKADFSNIPFEDKTFDGIISISALQWITGKSYSEVIEHFNKTAREFYRVLKKKGKAVIQFYPKTEEEFNIVIESFKKAGFSILIAEDFPNTKKRKRYLILTKG